MATNTPHFVLLPFMAQGHTIPMLDIARLLANRRLKVTILTTLHNSNRFKPVIDRAVASGRLNIHLVLMKFPSVQAGLPDGCEIYDTLPSIHDSMKFFAAIKMLQPQVESLLQDLNPFPTCLIADMSFPWATNVARKFKIPRIVFHGMNCFSRLCIHVLENSNCFENIASDKEYIEIPNLPRKIEITKAQFSATGSGLDSDWDKIVDQIRESEVEAFGVVVNSFEELEMEYVEEYTKVKGKKVWCVGPVSLCNNDDLDKLERGNKTSIDGDECLKWLDSQDTASVIYVSLGSIAQLPTAQLVELGLALEGSGRPFIWVIKKASREFEEWLVKLGFEERVRGRGILVKGWAPQVLILSHPSIGGFLSHCGWNSSLEGITAGIPTVTWPVIGEQFLNEKFIVDVIETGIRSGVEVPVFFGAEEEVGVQVKRDEIESAIERLMSGGDEGEERRRRAMKLKEMAWMAVEDGGSSYRNLTKLIQDVADSQQR